MNKQKRMKQILCFLLCVAVTLEGIWCMPEDELQLKDAELVVKEIGVTTYRDLKKNKTPKKGKAPKTKKKKALKKSKKTNKDKISNEEQVRVDAKNEAKLKGPKNNTYVEVFGSFSFASNDPCGNGGGGIMNEGQLHTAKLGNDGYCLTQLNGRDDVYSQMRCKEVTGNRHIWFSCNNGQFVNKGSNQCMQYNDNSSWDEIKVRDCNWNSKYQQFDKLDIKERKVKSNSFDGKASARTEFRLRARSGTNHCLSGFDCWPNGCYIGADYCNTSPEYRFFFKDNAKSRFDYWSKKEGRDFTFPNLYDEAHDGIIGSSIMYGLSTIRYELKHTDKKFKHLTTGEDISSDILDSLLRPSEEKVKVTLQDIYAVPTDWPGDLKKWLGIWTEKQRESVSLHYFSDTLPINTPLSYGIFIEKETKRVSVWIKGSEEHDSARDNYFNDWDGKNGKCDFRDFTDYRLDGKTTGVHNGYASAVDDNFFKIVSELQKLFLDETYNDYKVYVFGHSMGGAVSTLLGYRLALSLYENKISGIPKPISIVSLASPQVGGYRFQKSFTILEREGLLRHLRMENQEDWAPKTAGGSVPGLRGSACYIDVYDESKYVGIDVHLQYPKSYIAYTPAHAEVDYEDVQSRRLVPMSLLPPETYLPAPYDFIGKSRLETGGFFESYFHSPDAHMLLLYTTIKEEGYNLNDLYENWLA